MLFKIKSNLMHPLSSALPLLYVPAHVTRGALVAHRHSFAPPRCRTSQCRRTFVPLSVFFGTILVTLFLMVWDRQTSRAEPGRLPAFDGVGLADWRPVGMICYYFFFVSYYFLFFFLQWVGCVELGSLD